MKIITIYRNNNLESLLPALCRQDRLAQKKLFEQISPKMLSVCRFYVSDIHYAEDCMIKAFVKVFDKIKTYENKGSFEGWIRRIMVNECLDFLRSEKPILYLEDAEFIEEKTDFNEDLTGIDVQDLLDSLDTNYRIVFNLFVLEEYSHREIAKKLDISETASRTTLRRAKVKLKEILRNKNKRNERRV